MARKRPRFPNGIKLVVEDVEALADAAGRAEDAAIAKLSRVYVETSERKGYVQPWRDGNLVITDGATGKVKVLPFWGHMSPAGATTDGGTQRATGGTETVDADQVSGFFAGESISVPTPVPGAANHRWDLLYAIITTTTVDLATRLVKNAVTRVTAAQSIYTRTKVTVTLAWQQGVAAPTATDPYPIANMPTLPVAASGTAHVALALVNVQNNATPATVTYAIDEIANMPRLLRPNPRAGALVSMTTAGAGLTALSGSSNLDPYSLIGAIASANGGWKTSGANRRPARFVEQTSGGLDLMVQIGPFSTTVGQRTFAATFAASPVVPLNHDNDNFRYDMRNRVFHSNLYLAGGKFGHDPTGDTATGILPMAGDDRVGGGVLVSGGRLYESWGQTHRNVAAFDALIGSANYYVAGYFQSINSSAGTDLALAVHVTSGAMILFGREAVADELNGRIGFLRIRASDRFNNFSNT
jgi:hypothetical protein